MLGRGAGDEYLENDGFARRGVWGKCSSVSVLITNFVHWQEYLL